MDVKLSFQVGVCVWPILQTINFFLIPEHNRVVYVSFCSLMWTSFLAYMKARQAKQKQNDATNGNNVKHNEHGGSGINVEAVCQVEDKSKRISVIR